MVKEGSTVKGAEGDEKFIINFETTKDSATNPNSIQKVTVDGRGGRNRLAIAGLDSFIEQGYEVINDSNSKEIKIKKGETEHSIVSYNNIMGSPTVIDQKGKPVTVKTLSSNTATADSLTGEADESTGNFTRTVREFFGQSDSVTGDELANADTDSSGWFQMHHDDGIQDGYLDVGADASGFDSFLLQSGSDLIRPLPSPFTDYAAVTDLVTGKSSPMDTATNPLVAAGPLDAVKVDEPRNNDF